MLKKILSFILICIISIPLVACGGNNESTSVEEKENNKDKEELTLTDDDVSKIKENLETFTEGTAFDGATFKVELDKNTLKISVIKPIKDIMTTYKTTTADDTVEAIRKSLVFDDTYDAIKEETGLKFDSMQVFIFGSEDELKNNDYYTLKSIM